MAESLLTQVELNYARAGNEMATTVELKREQLLPGVVVWVVLEKEVKSVTSSGGILVLRNDRMLSLC